MSLRLQVERNAGHPWDGRDGFDVLHLHADTSGEMDAAVNAAKRKFWQCWLIGISDNGSGFGGAMYKPCNALFAWHDSPERPHPGGA